MSRQKKRKKNLNILCIIKSILNQINPFTQKKGEIKHGKFNRLGISMII